MKDSTRFKAAMSPSNFAMAFSFSFSSSLNFVIKEILSDGLDTDEKRTFADIKPSALPALNDCSAAKSLPKLQAGGEEAVVFSMS